MNIGFYFKFVGAEIGGSYTFQKNFLTSLLRMADKQHDIFILYSGKKQWKDDEVAANITFINIDDLPTPATTINGVGIKNLIPQPVQKIINKVNLLFTYYNTKIQYYNNYNNKIQHIVDKYGIDFFYFVHPTYYALKIPFAITVWDLAHRRHPYLPEESYMHNNFQRKDNFFANVLPRASMIATGTNESKKQIIKYYNCEEELIKVIPFPVIEDLVVADVVAPGKELPSEYFFYPAQMWSQKNHIVLLKALEILKKKGKKYHFVFTGSDQGNYTYIKNKISELELTDQITFADFVDRGQLKYLYQNAIAMVFPAIIGPDNLPPIEAMSLGCPVLCGNYEGATDQLGDTALFFDRLNEEDLAGKMENVFENIDLRKELIAKGYNLTNELGNFDNYLNKIYSHLNIYQKIIRTWKDS
ncbi:glycosyltransferase family 4 protein [Ferruginibacter sp. SUN002]|uniref:glycosyltransferase family 4 protein n=1 Tax=Ferruginibacter sp. SUN002 TaxID=2937789 RepID=UPI003D36B487